MNKQFYEKVLPTQGVYCAASINKNKNVKHRYAETLEDLLTILEGMNSEELNVYVAPCTFKGYARLAKDAVFARSFFIDLDVNHGDVCYDSREAALAGLDQFLATSELPPPIRVCSGFGVQAYWPFWDDVLIEEWLPYAKKFKDYCIAKGLRIDPSVTADAARIMRCPGTLNYKTEQPQPAYLIDETDHLSFSFEQFKSFLGVIEVDPLDEILKTAKKGLDDDTLKMLKLDNFHTSFQKIAERSLHDDGCAQIKHILVSATTLSQPMWHSGLSIARHCVDWEAAIHLISEDYPGYNYEATEKKANETLDKPHSCATFEDRNPGGCDGCPHKGKITNPLALGRELRQAEPAVVPAQAATDTTGPQQGGQGSTKGGKGPDFPEYLSPFYRPPMGGIYFNPPPDVGKDGKKQFHDPVRLTTFDVYPTKRVYSPTDAECMIIRCVLPNDPEREFLLPMRTALSKDELMKFISQTGVSPEPSHSSMLVQYMKKWSEYLIMTNPAEQLRMQMGWSEDNDSFVIGNMEILRDGTTRPTAASPMVKNIAKLLKPVGDMREWQKSMHRLNAPGYELIAFGALCGFGSPLMRHASNPGMTFCYTSGNSGVGKSGSLFSGLSVYGDPIGLSVMESASTGNAFIGRMINLKNLFFAIDEVTTSKIEDLPKLIHQISQGKPKMRMQASVNAERDLEASASLIAMFTSNRDIYDSLHLVKGNPDGEMARIMQFMLELPPGMTNEVGRELFEPLKTNYGMAGPMFTKELFKRGDVSVKASVLKWHRLVEERIGTSSAYRFYNSGVSAAMAGGEIARDMGLIDFDLDRIFNIVMKNVAIVCNDPTTLNKPDHHSSLGAFMNKYWAGVLIVEGSKILSEPRMGAVVGRISVEDQKLFVAKADLKKYLSEIQTSVTEFERALEGDGTLVNKTGKQRLASGWKIGGAAPAVNVYEFRYTLTDQTIRELKGET